MKTLLFIILIFTSIISNAADRYWVGGTGTWNASSTTVWSSTSGGGSGASVPTSADNVFFDGSSGGGTATLAATVSALTLTTTGFTGTIGGSSFFIAVSGNITLSSGLILGCRIDFVASGTFTPNGATINSTFFRCNTSGVTTTMGGDLVATSATLTYSSGTFTSNNYNVKCGNFTWGVTGATTINMGSSVFEMTGTELYMDAANVTINAGTSTFKCTNTDNVLVTFGGAGKTFYNLWFARGASTGTNTITGANTFNDIKDDGTAAHTIIFPNVTTTVSSFTVSGTAGNLITLARTGGSGTFTLSKSSGNVCRDYLSISNSTATGGASWYAGVNSTNGGSNTGWAFSSCPTTSTTNFFFNP